MKNETVFDSIVKRAIGEWQVSYRDVCNFTCDISGLHIPAPREGFTRLIIVAQGMDPQRAFSQCNQLFPAWKYTEDSLDTAVPTNDRDPKNGSYAIWMRDRVEADEELANKSANDLKQEKISGNTLLERLLLELKYFGETGKHLDINNVTACTGSRYSDGRVPRVYWGGVRLRVDWDSVGNRYPSWRSREVVS
jgi:hypothetical protein